MPAGTQIHKRGVGSSDNTTIPELFPQFFDVTHVQLIEDIVFRIYLNPNAETSNTLNVGLHQSVGDINKYG